MTAAAGADGGLTPDEARAVFRECGAVLEGHFILSSGLHSPTFLQKARVFMHAPATERLCRGLAAAIRRAVGGEIGAEIGAVVGPAIGGIVPAYETARQLGVPAAWVERDGGDGKGGGDGGFRLKRFEFAPGTRCVVVEDIVTTGLSLREAIACLRDAGLEVAAAACLIDRSGGRADVGVPLVALAEWEIPTYSADALPPELAALPATKPGSRPDAAARA